MMRNEVVSQCQATRMDSGLYTAAAEAQLIAFVIRDSMFMHNFLTLLHFDQISLYCGNCTFSNDEVEAGFDMTKNLNKSKMKTAFENLEARVAADIKTLMFRDYKETLDEHFDKKSGLVLKPGAAELLQKKIRR